MVTGFSADMILSQQLGRNQLRILVKLRKRRWKMDGIRVG